MTHVHDEYRCTDCGHRVADAGEDCDLCAHDGASALANEVERILAGAR
jgi:rubrerythrin